MAIKADCGIADVPRLIERGGIKDLLTARGALLYEAETLIEKSVTEARALKPDEQRSFDDYSIQMREINARLADYKRDRIADSAGTGLSPVLPF